MRDDLKHEHIAHAALDQQRAPASLCDLCECCAYCLRRDAERPCERQHNQGRGSWRQQAVQRQQRVKGRARWRERGVRVVDAVLALGIVAVVAAWAVLS